MIQLPDKIYVQKILHWVKVQELCELVEDNLEKFVGPEWTKENTEVRPSYDGEIVIESNTLETDEEYRIRVEKINREAITERQKALEAIERLKKAYGIE